MSQSLPDGIGGTVSNIIERAKVVRAISAEIDAIDWQGADRSEDIHLGDGFVLEPVDPWLERAAKLAARDAHRARNQIDKERLLNAIGKIFLPPLSLLLLGLAMRWVALGFRT
ncbi:MAG: hypothetical protein ACXIUW_08555 [Roseinatronobacter sp.]